MTRNTKFYKMKDIYYKDLTTIELTVLNNVKNQIVKREMAATFAIDNKDPKEVPFELLIQIGEDAIHRSELMLMDTALLDVTIAEFRKNIKGGDPIMAWISHITKFFPGTSVVDLLNLTPKDLVELVVLAEEMSGEKVFGAKQKKQMNFVKPSDLDDEGKKALRDQIRDLNNNIGIR